MDNEKLQGYVRHGLRFAKALVKWVLLGSLVGIIVGMVAACFAHVLGFVNGLRGSYPFRRCRRLM